MAKKKRRTRPGCCELAGRNLAWFDREEAWHPASFARDPRRDRPPSAPLSACPFCGEKLVPPKARPR